MRTYDVTKLFQFIIAMFIMAMVGGAMLALLSDRSIPEVNRSLLTYMIGNIMGIAATVAAFYFPSSVGSAKKDESINSLATTLRNATTAPAPISTDDSGNTNAG